jgi:hypothetical protein
VAVDAPPDGEVTHEAAGTDAALRARGDGLEVCDYDIAASIAAILFAAHVHEREDLVAARCQVVPVVLEPTVAAPVRIEAARHLRLRARDCRACDCPASQHVHLVTHPGGRA